MGANVSQEINAAASESINIINNQTQNCVTTTSQTQLVQVCGGAQGCGPNSTVTVNNVDFTQDVQYTTDCTSDINITTDIQAQINQAFSQAATAIAQQFQLSAANVNNVANLASTIATNIDTTTVQNCTQQAAQSQGIQINCNPQGNNFCNVVISNNGFSQGFSGINNCILEETNAQAVIAGVTQQVQQSGTAKVESLLGPIIAIILIIIIILGSVYFGGVKVLSDWRFWVVIIVVVLIYLGLAFWRKWFPFD